MKLLVNELFETMQGEAAFTGSPAVFVRLQKCPVGCPWCDTKHTWTAEPANEIAFGAMVAKVDDAPTYARATPSELANWLLLNTRARHIVLTGGEPALYDLTEVTGLLLEAGRMVQIETSGTSPVRVHPGAWVTVSPKIGMPGGLRVRPDALARANEIKMPVGKQADVDKLLAFLTENPVDAVVWLQPLSQNEKATELCLRAATEHGWRVSIQTHKFLGVR